MAEAVSPTLGNARIKRRRIEIACAVLLGFGGAASAWGSYQSSLWDGQQMAAYALGNATRVASTEALTRAGQQSLVDVSTFLAWANAYATGNEVLDTFFKDRFRPEFRAPFEEWVAMRPRLNPNAASTPFELPSYRLASAVRAKELAARAEELSAQGNHANGISDRYSRTVVAFALGTFLAGVAHLFRGFKIRIVVVCFSSALMLLGLAALAFLPVDRGF